MEAKAHIKYIRMSPLKLRELLPVLKTLSPKVALDRLGFSQQRNAKAFYKAIKSAVSNAQGIAGFDAEKAAFKTLKVDEGPYFRRFRPGARGTAKPYVRKTSHITVVIEQKGLTVSEKAQQKVSKPTEQKVEKISEPLAKVEKITKKKVTIKDSEKK